MLPKNRRFSVSLKMHVYYCTPVNSHNAGLGPSTNPNQVRSSDQTLKKVSVISYVRNCVQETTCLFH